MFAVGNARVIVGILLKHGVGQPTRRGVKGFRSCLKKRSDEPRTGSNHDELRLTAERNATRILESKRRRYVLVPRTSTGPSIHIVAVPTLPPFATRTSYVSFSPTEKGGVAFSKGARLLAHTPMTARAMNPGRPSWMAQRARRGARSNSLEDGPRSGEGKPYTLIGRAR